MKHCQGIVVRAIVNHTYVSYPKKSIERFNCNIQLNVLRRKSCKGCEQCGGIWDAMPEVSDDWPIEGIEDCSHKKLYKLVPVGYEEDWHLELAEVKE